MACIGGTETFGRFVDRPFASILEQNLDRRCVNLGSLFCGVEALCRDEGVRDLMQRAELCVLQLPDVIGQSNRFYRVHARRNDRFLAPSDDLVALYPDVDFADINFVHHLIAQLQAHQDARFEVVADELRKNWVRLINGLLADLNTPAVLLALTVKSGEASPLVSVDADVIVTPKMVDALRPFSAAIVEASVSVSGQSDELEDMLFGTLQQPMAEHMIGPAAHRSIAGALASAISDVS